jgi:predicted N-acyltransferase
VLRNAGLIHRIGCQFHWRNQGYRDFRDFLETLTAKRRKEILRERRKVIEAGIKIQRRSGDELSANDWARFHELYRSTFEKHANFPALTLGFFQSIGKTMGEKILLVEAVSEEQLVASAFFMVSDIGVNQLTH